jgi:hypothetical protein
MQQQTKTQESAFERAQRWSKQIPGEPIPITLSEAWEIAEHLATLQSHSQRSTIEIQMMIIQGWTAIGKSPLVIL